MFILRKKILILCKFPQRSCKGFTRSYRNAFVTNQTIWGRIGPPPPPHPLTVFFDPACGHIFWIFLHLYRRLLLLSFFFYDFGRIDVFVSSAHLIYPGAFLIYRISWTDGTCVLAACRFCVRSLVCLCGRNQWTIVDTWMICTGNSHQSTLQWIRIVDIVLLLPIVVSSSG